MNGQAAACSRSRLRRITASLIGAASVLWLSGTLWAPSVYASNDSDHLEHQSEQPPLLTPPVESNSADVSAEIVTEYTPQDDDVPWDRLEQTISPPQENLFVPSEAANANVNVNEPEKSQQAHSDNQPSDSDEDAPTASKAPRRMQLLHPPGTVSHPGSNRSVASSHNQAERTVVNRNTVVNNNSQITGDGTAIGDGIGNDTGDSAVDGADSSIVFEQVDFVTQPQPAAVPFVTNPSVTNPGEQTAIVGSEPTEPLVEAARASEATAPARVAPVAIAPSRPGQARSQQVPFFAQPAEPAPVSVASVQPQGLSIPSGYVEMSDGVYVPAAFIHYDIQFRQAREARIQAWEAYQAAMYDQSAMIAALLPASLWQSNNDGSNPYLNQVAFSNTSLSAFRTTPTNMSVTASIPTGFTTSSSLNPTYSGMVNSPSLVTAFASDTFPLYPLPSPVELTSPHGWRTHPISGQQAFHDGVDLGAPAGTPVLATLSGVVESAGWNGGYGNTVTIRHLNGNLQTLYAHLSQAYVEPGEAIRQGQIIGAVGSTGNSTGPHLHYEMNQLVNGSWKSIDNTDLVLFAQRLVEHQQYLQYYSQHIQPNQLSNGQLTSSTHPSSSQIYSVSSSSSPSATNVANEIRVGIELDVDSFTIGSTVPLTITDTNNQPIANLPGGAAYSVTRASNGAIDIGGQTYDTTAIFVQPASPNAQVAIDGRNYRGRMLIGARPQGGVSAINWVDQEQYLYSVVGSEVYPSWNSEALRAQAVAARSYSTYYRHNPVSPDWYDIGDDTYYQAYSGSAREYGTTTQAVNDTRGQVLMQGSIVLQAMYAATREISIEAHNGIGMAQWGAADKAAQGWNYTAILSHYYPGSQLAVMN